MRRRVWAPEAARVDLCSAGRPRAAMIAVGGGWWEVEDPSGDPYCFSLDGGPPRPDPRSGWQPEGPEGPSRDVDHANFAWSAQPWAGLTVASAVVYELHVGTFSPSGTFDGVVERLDHLVDLGVDAIELLPVAEFPGERGWGYDGVDLYAPHHAYGGPDGLKRLVDACHARGLGVILDVVYNHLGPAGNHLAEFGPYFTEEHRTPWGQAVNLDGPGADEVRRWVIDNARQWAAEYRVDGLRLDATHALHDESATHLLEELAGELHALGVARGHPVAIIAEHDLNDPRLVRPVEAGGYGLDAVWNDEFHHALHALLTGETAGYYGDYGGIAPLAHVLRRVWVHDGRYAPSRGRRIGRPAGDLPGWRFVVCSQNHDQVGNRAHGERLAALVTTGRLQQAAALTLCSPFVPLLFQGEEWAASTPFQYFTDHDDPALAQAVREGRRREFRAAMAEGEPPDPQSPDTFHRSKLDWEERSHGAHATMLGWYRDLIGLRRGGLGLGSGRLGDIRVSYDEDEQWLVVDRGQALVACNFAPKSRCLPTGTGSVQLSSDDGAQLRSGSLRLGPDGCAVLTR